MEERIVEAVRKDGLGRRLKDVFISCYDKIIARKIMTVGELLKYLEELGWDPRLESVIRRCYRLIREIHWGIFRDLDPDDHPDLWKSLTISNPTMPKVADLKRNVLVPNVYCGILDIHAYTDFCQRNRHNASILRTLDNIIQNDMREIANKNGCLSCRSAGDAIIVIGSSATDMIRACLGIIDLFSRRRVLQSALLSENRKGSSVVMQDFHVSAGIAGGLHYSSLIVTQDGDISGSVVNAAARLQGFAGTVAPDQSKVMVTSHVYSSYVKDVRGRQSNGDGFNFFNCGRITFKGTSLSVFELLYSEREMKKVRYQKQYMALLRTLSKGTWSERLVPDIARLVLQVLNTTAIQRVEIVHRGKTRTYTNDVVVGLCNEAIELYESSQDHRRVSSLLLQIADVLDAAAGFDPLVLAHLRQVTTVYDQMTREFESLQYQKIIANQDGLFSMKERDLIDRAGRLERARNQLLERGRRNNNIYSPAVLWNKVVSEYEGRWEFEVYSGKR
jgi:class 3 adenylate cyclase